MGKESFAARHKKCLILWGAQAFQIFFPMLFKFQPTIQRECKHNIILQNSSLFLISHNKSVSAAVPQNKNKKKSFSTTREINKDGLRFRLRDLPKVLGRPTLIVVKDWCPWSLFFFFLLKIVFRAEMYFRSKYIAEIFQHKPEWFNFWNETKQRCTCVHVSN